MRSASTGYGTKLKQFLGPVKPVRTERECMTVSRYRNSTTGTILRYCKGSRSGFAHPVLLSTLRHVSTAGTDLQHPADSFSNEQQVKSTGLP